MGMLHQSMNVTVSSRARAPFCYPEANEGEFSASWRAYSPTRSNNASYKPTIMSLVNARNSLPNPLDMEEYAWNKLRLKVEQRDHPKVIAKEKLVEVFRRRQAAHYKEFEQSRKYQNVLRGILEPPSIKAPPTRIFKSLESHENFELGSKT